MAGGDAVRAVDVVALLYRTLATLRVDAPTIADVDELRWTGPRPVEAWSGTMYAR